MKRQTTSLSFNARSAIAIAAGLMLVAMYGCASDRAPQAGAVKSMVTVGAWTYGKSATGRTLYSPHYAIHTTIPNQDFNESLAELMEAALAQYQQFAPGVAMSSEPLECYVFQDRTEWAGFTREKTGDDAALYLQINRGGYTVRDWYVAYYISEVGTYAVAAHEGWHQYVARHFKSRLPPFLEEGIATMFENVQFYSSPPKFDLSPRTQRAMKLRDAIEQNNLWPLEKLIVMHAGDVVSLPGPKIEAFYAQNWAFAEFLWDADRARYRPALQRLLSDCAAGDVYPQFHQPMRRGTADSWNPQTVRPMLEHYLGMSLGEIDAAYQAYCRKIAFAQRRYTRP